MNVLHVISGLSKFGGGTAEAVSKICLAQVGVGLNVVLVAFDYGEMPPALSKAVAGGVKYVPMKKNISPCFPSLDMIRRLPSLVRAADVVHIHSQWHFPVWYAAWLSRRCRKPYVMMPHGSLMQDALRCSRLKKKIVGTILDRPSLRKASRVFATSDQEGDAIWHYGIDAGNIRVRPLGVSTEEFPEMPDAALAALRKRLGLSADKRILLYLSRISEEKGVDLLRRVWMKLAVRHRNWVLVLVGAADHHGYLEVAKARYGKTCEKGSYSFTGPLYRDDRATVLQMASCFVLPSYHENFSFAVAEAMYNRLPVLATQGTPWRVLEDLNAGAWVGSTEKEISEALDRLMSMSDEDRREMGLRGREYVMSALTWEIVAEKMRNEYALLCKKGVLP